MRTPIGSIPVIVPIALERLAAIARAGDELHPWRTYKALSSLAEIARMATAKYHEARAYCEREGIKIPPPEDLGATTVR